MIEILEKSKCCGCAACANICPKQCISMAEDDEGFFYPAIRKDKCIDCGLCEKVCPVINVGHDVPFEQDAYLVQIMDARIREDSTAGGAFTAIANYVLDNQGVVFGAAYDERFRVHHVMVESVDELWRFRNSKYVQSDTSDTFAQVRNFLNCGRMVCYSGTPCQIEGLKGFLRKDYEKLITVDVVCHAVPSPLIWRKYLEMQKEKYGGDIGNIRFRDKHYGYKYSTMTMKNKAGKDLYAFGIDTDPMLRAFFSNICDRPSCYECVFKKRYRVSDFTIWDCFPVYKFAKDMDDDKGTTRLLVHSDKGRKIFAKIQNQFRFCKVESDELTKGVKEMFFSVPINDLRTSFFEDARLLSGKDLFEKYFPKTLKVKIERVTRVFCVRTGIYSFAKRAATRVLRK